MDRKLRSTSESIHAVGTLSNSVHRTEDLISIPIGSEGWNKLSEQNNQYVAWNNLYLKRVAILVGDHEPQLCLNKKQPPISYSTLHPKATLLYHGTTWTVTILRSSPTRCNKYCGGARVYYPSSRNFYHWFMSI